MPSFMWYIIGGAIVLLVLGYVASLIIGALNFRRMKRNFDEMKDDIDHEFDKPLYDRHRRF